jgi:serine phosphatase RsbU (regulator of sigma subunit)
MRIRTQLILASFVLAVLPLAAIVIWSYHSSREALEAVQGRETARLTRQMDRRLAGIRRDLEQRLAVVSALPLQQPGATTERNNEAVVGNIVTAMGDVAGLVDSLEFHPVPVAAAAPAAEPEPPQAPAAPRVVVEDVHPEPLIIDIPPPPEIPRFTMSEDQQVLIRKIGTLAGKLSSPTLAAGERAALDAELEEAKKELNREMAVTRKQFEEEMRAAQEVNNVRRELLLEKARGDRDRAREARRRDRLAGVTAKTTPTLSVADKEKLKATQKRVSLIFGRDFAAPVRTDGAVVGQLSARVRPEEVIQRVLGAPNDDTDEVPFAVDREGNVYTRTVEEKDRLELLGVARRLREGKSLNDIEGWIVSVKTDRQSGLRIGVARPVGENLTELKKTAARNFVLGLGLIAFAVIGVVPLANHLSRDVQLVTSGAQRIAHGDLMTRLPVESKNEFGQLAMAFNRMAEDLSVQQQRLVEQERSQKEQELQQRLMAVEYERKSFELEEARRFQLSMLPKEVPRHDAYDVAVYTRTATEVGGDYYDFHIGDGTFAVTIGDATGHGAKAGTMVTVIKTLFSGYSSNTSPSQFLGDAAEKIKRMDLGRMAMALALARFDGPKLTLASAGMPPVLIHRAKSGSVDEIALEATPLGTLGTEYDQTEIAIDAGDTVLFMSDGFPELFNDAGVQVGYAGALDAFASAATAATAEAVVSQLTDVAHRWHGDLPPNDDVTFVAVRVRAV